MPTLEIPKGYAGTITEYLASFSASFMKYQKAKAPLESAAQNIRQAKLLIKEPLGHFACITAEEEASMFFYQCLKYSGYKMPAFEPTNHSDKATMMLWALVIQEHFFSAQAHMFGQLTTKVRWEGSTVAVSTHGSFQIFNDAGSEVYGVEIPNIFSMVATKDGLPEGPTIVANESVDLALDAALHGYDSIEDAIAELANRRNLCLYGRPDAKPVLDSLEALHQFDRNCCSIILLGFLVMQDDTKYPSLQLICDVAGEKLKASAIRRKKFPSPHAKEAEEGQIDDLLSAINARFDRIVRDAAVAGWQPEEINNAFSRILSDKLAH